MKPLKRILLVEDSENDIELTLTSLAEYHLANEVVIARDGAEALELLFGPSGGEPCREKPVVILLDLKLPKVSGLEVLQRIKSDPELKRIPVVVLTSSREEPDLRQCYDLGCNAYVVKPVDFTRFAEAVKQLGCFWAVINEVPR